MSLREDIFDYKAESEAEEGDKQAFLQFLSAFNENVYTRDNLVGHITASAFVVNKERTKVLMAFHNTFKNWSWLGGHADGDKDLLTVAIRETKEESGASDVRAIITEPVDINICEVFPHIKRGKYVNTHLHYNPTYLLEVDENEKICREPDENQAVGWIKFEDIVEKCKEEQMIPYYLRIVKKIRERKL